MTDEPSYEVRTKAIVHNARWFMPVQPLDKTNEPHGLAQLGGVSGENKT